MAMQSTQVLLSYSCLIFLFVVSFAMLQRVQECFFMSLSALVLVFPAVSVPVLVYLCICVFVCVCVCVYVCVFVCISFCLCPCLSLSLSVSLRLSASVPLSVPLCLPVQLFVQIEYLKRSSFSVPNSINKQISTSAKKTDDCSTNAQCLVDLLLHQ